MSLPPPLSKCLIKQLRLSPLTPSTVELHNGLHKVLSWEYIQHSAFNRGSPGDFSWGKKVPVWWDNLAFFFFFFPSCSAPTGVPQHRQEGRSLSRGSSAGASRRAQAERATLQRTIRKWFRPCLTKQSPERLCATYITFSPPTPLLALSNNPALCHISANIHTLSLPSPPLIKTWEQTTSFALDDFAAGQHLRSRKKPKRKKKKKKDFSDISVD